MPSSRDGNRVLPPIWLATIWSNDTPARMSTSDFFTDAAAGTLPGFYIEAIAVAERGAWPGALLDEYADDPAHVSDYARLARIKRQYDPDGLFVVHHGVGSDDWSADGFTRLR